MHISNTHHTSENPTARCNVKSLEARIMSDGQIETHCQAFRLDETPRDVDLRSSDHLSSIHVEMGAHALHATVVGSDSAELELDLEIEDELGAGIEAWGVAAARNANAVILQDSGEVRGARICGLFGTGGGPRTLRAGSYTLRATVVEGTIMIRLGLDGEHKRI
jgi:hypothetical protein